VYRALVLAFIVAAPALAAGDPEAGRALARQWCAGCHGASDAVPPLDEAVNRPGRTPGTLEAWLADPHPPMPNLSLSRREINDLVAFLGTLQRGR
jgi:mono/diheme cytochrome c family protein